MFEFLIGIVAIVVFIAGVSTLGVMLFVVATQMLRGIARLRFSLRAMMITVLCGGVCETLLANRESPLLVFIGILCTIAFATVIILHLLELGGQPDSKAESVPIKRDGIIILNPGGDQHATAAEPDEMCETEMP